MIEMTQTFGEKLKTIRKEKNLTLKEIGERVGVTEQAVHYWEIGTKKPRDSIKIKLSEELGESIESLFFQK